MMENFVYDIPSKEIIYNGQQLDSLLELKFVLSIEESHGWIRDGLEMYYNINSSETGIKGGLEKHTPDFLVRNWQTAIATLVEIKPDEYDDYYELRWREKIARNFIRKFAYDWEYKVIRARHIILTTPQLEKFESIINGKYNTYPAWYGGSHQNNTSFTDDQYDHFVRTGLLPAETP